jgi:hypothetical protein
MNFEQKIKNVFGFGIIHIDKFGDYHRVVIDRTLMPRHMDELRKKGLNWLAIEPNNNKLTLYFK